VKELMHGVSGTIIIMSKTNIRERSKLSGTCFYENLYKRDNFYSEGKAIKCARLGGYYTFPVIKNTQF
jgi:hypothetical protein